MLFFGKEIDLWRDRCSVSGIPPDRSRPFVNLFVKVTDACDASCPFCCNAGHHAKGDFDIDKLFRVIDGICASGARLNRISLTGGEPSMRPDTVEEIVSGIAAMPSCAFTQLHLNTNGLSPDSVRLMSLPRIDSVSLSMHHYDPDRRRELFGRTDGYSEPDLSAVSRNKLNISCNLIRDYIDSAEEVGRMIAYVSGLGVRSMGFVGLMPANDYCRERYVDMSEIDFSSIPGLMPVETRSREGRCRCRNYLYIGDDMPVDVYMRESLDPTYCESSLLFDGRFLRQGFHKDDIIC